MEQVTDLVRPDGTEMPLSFEAWADLSARMMKRSERWRLDLLDVVQIEPDDWRRCDEHYARVLAGDLRQGRVDRAELYARTCVAEVERREHEDAPTPAPEEERAPIAEPIPPMPSPSPAVPSFLLALPAPVLAAPSPAVIMHVKSTANKNPRRARATALGAGRPNAVRPAKPAKGSPPPVLSEFDLIRAYQAGDAWAGNALLQTHAELIYETARPYFHGPYRDDVLQEVRLGFLECVKRFDETAGLSLTTYAKHRMWHAAENFLAENASLIRVPDHAQRRGANADAKDLAQTAMHCISLDAPLGDDDGQARGVLIGDEDGETLGDVLSNGCETPETLTTIALQRTLCRRMMAPLLESLSPLEREILLCCVMAEKGSEETHAAFGAKIGVSGKRVERMLYAVLKKLRRRLAMVGVNALEDVDEADRETVARVQRLLPVRKNGGG